MLLTCVNKDFSRLLRVQKSLRCFKDNSCKRTDVSVGVRRCGDITLLAGGPTARLASGMPVGILLLPHCPNSGAAAVLAKETVFSVN